MVQGMEPWMSVAEVAFRCMVSRQSVWRWIRSGRLPAKSIGKSYVVHRDNADRMMSLRRELATLKMRPFLRRRRRNER